MSSLRSRFGLQGLDHHGVALADQPGLVLKGKQLSFYSLTQKPPAGVDALAGLKIVFAKVLSDARRDDELADLHLYYLDAEGHAIFSLPTQLSHPPILRIGDKHVDTRPLNSLKVVRHFEAVGKTGLRFRTKEEIRDVYTALEMFQTAYQLGWGGQFFARDAEARTTIFRHYDPFRTGLLRVEERLNNLSCSVQLFQESASDDLLGYRAVRTSLETVTLEEALAWT